MSGRQNHDYYSRRAEQERDIASQCADSGAARVHEQLANAYERRKRTLSADENARIPS